MVVLTDHQVQGADPGHFHDGQQRGDLGADAAQGHGSVARHRLSTAAPRQRRRGHHRRRRRHRGHAGGESGHRGNHPRITLCDAHQGERYMPLDR